MLFLSAVRYFVLPVSILSPNCAPHALTRSLHADGRVTQGIHLTDRASLSLHTRLTLDLPSSSSQLVVMRMPSP
jgi:hypothetical protein